MIALPLPSPRLRVPASPRHLQTIPAFPRRFLEFLTGHLKHGTSGHLLRSAAGHLINTCGGGGSPAPCVCPPGLASTYTVSGFGGLAGCDGCDSSTDGEWSGALYHVGTGCAWWAADDNFDPLSINGTKLHITYTQLILSTTACRWELYIACSAPALPPVKMWVGYKTTGNTPAGTYSLASSDCGNTQATMTVS